MTSSRSAASLATLGIVGPAVFVVVVGYAGTLFPDYSHVRQPISELGGVEAPYPLVQNLNFLFLGISIVAFAWALRAVAGRSRAPAFIAVLGLSSAIANAVLPCDAGCQGQTIVGLLHNITGLLGFVAGLIGMELLARVWSGDEQWRSHSRLTRVLLAMGVAGLVTFVAMRATGGQAFDGLAQRVFVLALLLWVGVTAVRIRRFLALGGGSP